MPRLKQKAPSLDELIGDKPKKTRGRKASKKRTRKVVAETPAEAAPQVVTVAPVEIAPGSEWAHQGIKRNHF